MGTTNAVSYLRVSGRAQIEKDGFPRQRDAIARYARQHGIELVGEYRDEGVSGTRDLDNREGLRDLLTRIRSNGVRLVLVENATRLARDLMVGEVILREFRDARVSVVAADSGTDLTVGDDDPTRKLIRQVLGAVAEFEKCILVAKLKAARVRMRRTQGRCEGRKPFGTYAGEAEILDHIVKVRRKPRKGERLSFAKIADALNKGGLPTRSGRPWAPGTVRQIVMRRQPARTV
jgi:DNA invertase Pin-like site-specific DNA recombinase